MFSFERGFEIVCFNELLSTCSQNLQLFIFLNCFETVFEIRKLTHILSKSEHSLDVIESQTENHMQAATYLGTSYLEVKKKKQPYTNAAIPQKI